MSLRTDPAIIQALHKAAERADVTVNRWLTLEIVKSLKREGDGTVFPIRRAYRRRRIVEAESGQVEARL